MDLIVVIFNPASRKEVGAAPIVVMEFCTVQSPHDY